MSGTITYRYPVGTTFDSASVAPVSNDAVNRLLTFSFSNLAPYAANYIYVNLNADSTLALGSLTYDTMWVNPISGDATPANNVSSITDSVVASWDPNSKSVSPKGLDDQGYIDANTSDISYLIHFQNTGNGPARQVVVRDTISQYIELSSVRVTGASHEHTWQVVGSELAVTFSNINLPDSGTNSSASQGYIMVHAKLKPGLVAGNQILNTAWIYFDANAPVTTNTVMNTITGTYLGIPQLSNLEFALIPNPASNSVSIRSQLESGSVYQLIDQLGQTLTDGRINSNNTILNLERFSAGVYLVKVMSNGQTGTQRLVIVK
jgi:uncharacterized repeat protein (TIGR01451 family)